MLQLSSQSGGVFESLNAQAWHKLQTLTAAKGETFCRRWRMVIVDDLPEGLVVSSDQNITNQLTQALGRNLALCLLVPSTELEAVWQSLFAVHRDGVKGAEKGLVQEAKKNTVLPFTNPRGEHRSRLWDEIEKYTHQPGVPATARTLAEPARRVQAVKGKLLPPPPRSEKTKGHFTGMPNDPSLVPPGAAEAKAASEVAAGVESLVDQAAIEKLKTRYIVGKIAGVDLYDDAGAAIVRQGQVIDAGILREAEESGKLVELIVNMVIPELAE